MLVANDFLPAREGAASTKSIATASYFIAQAIPMITGAEGLATFLDVIVPLTGRTGVEAPSDHIIASLVSGISYLVIPTASIAAHRFDRKVLKEAVIFMLFASGAIISIFAAPGMEAFDYLHPKRVLCLYMEDTSSNTLSLHIAGLDPSPFEQLVENLADKLELQERPVLSEISDDIADWDIVCFLSTNSILQQRLIVFLFDDVDIPSQSISTFLQDSIASTAINLCFTLQRYLQSRTSAIPP